MLNKFYGFTRLALAGVIGFLFLSLPLVYTNAAEEEKIVPQISLKIFDEDVATARRQMRKYCAIVQELMIAKSLDINKQQVAAQYLKESQKMWNELRKKYQDNPPIEYSRDKKFKVRLSDISVAYEDMLSHLEERNAKRSFQACGFACGLFVSMHEENDLLYGLDRLFHVRKVIKAANAVNKNDGLEGVQKMLPDLLQKRDDIFMAPCPWLDDTKKCHEYAAAIKNLSSELDDFALAVTKRDNEEASKILNGLLELCNTAYGLAL